MFNISQKAVVLSRTTKLKQTLMKRRGVIGLLWVILLLLAFVPFARSINNYWLSETPTIIQQVQQTSWGNIWIPVKDFFRPVAYSIWKLESTLFGVDLRWFHLDSILLHFLNITLLMLLVYNLTRNPIASFVAGSFFALHWVHHQPIMWVASRETSLFLLFWLLSFVGYHTFIKKNIGWAYLLSLIGYIFSFLTKESSLTLPLYLASMGLLFHKELKLKQIVGHMIPFVIVGAIYLTFRQFTTGGLTQYDVIYKPTLMLANIIILLQHLFFPLFIVNFSEPWTYHLIANQKLLLLFILLGLFAIVVWMLYRLFRQNRGVGFQLAVFGLIWTGVQLIFISPMGTERMLYSISLGASIFFTGIFVRIWEQTISKKIWCGIGLVLTSYLLAMWYGCFTMASFYEKASNFSHRVIEETKSVCMNIPDNEMVFFIGTPSRLYTPSGVTSVDIMQFGIGELLYLQNIRRGKIYQNSRVKPPYRYVRNENELNAFVKFVKEAYKPPNATEPIHFLTYHKGHVRRVLDPSTFPWEETTLYYQLRPGNIIVAKR